MSKLHKKIALHSFFAALLTLGAVSSVSAAPNLWWDHFESGAASQTECVKQAESILTAEKAGQLSSDADSVRSWNEKTVGVVECIQFGDKLIVAVLVSSEDAVAGNALYNALRLGMAKK
jgi:hypothetical protein